MLKSSQVVRGAPCYCRYEPLRPQAFEHKESYISDAAVQADRKLTLTRAGTCGSDEQGGAGLWTNVFVVVSWTFGWGFEFRCAPDRPPILGGSDKPD